MFALKLSVLAALLLRALGSDFYDTDFIAPSFNAILDAASAQPKLRKFFTIAILLFLLRL